MTAAAPAGYSREANFNKVDGHLPDDSHSDFVRRVRERLEALGMSEAELAKRLGYRSRGTVNHWMHGESSPPVRELKRIAKALECRACELVLEDGEVAPPPVEGEIPPGTIVAVVPKDNPLHKVADVAAKTGMRVMLATKDDVARQKRKSRRKKSTR